MRFRQVHITSTRASLSCCHARCTPACATLARPTMALRRRVHVFAMGNGDTLSKYISHSDNMSHKCKHTHHMWHIVTIFAPNHNTSVVQNPSASSQPLWLLPCDRDKILSRASWRRCQACRPNWRMIFATTWYQRVHICDRSQGKDWTNSMSTFHFRISPLSFSSKAWNTLNRGTSTNMTLSAIMVPFMFETFRALFSTKRYKKLPICSG